MAFTGKLFIYISIYTYIYHCLKANFGLLNWQEDSHAYLMLISVFYLTWSKGYRDPLYYVESQSLVRHIMKVWT